MKLLMLTPDGACFVSFLAERCVDHRSRCVYIHNWSCRGRVQISGDIQFTRVAIACVNGEFFENFEACKVYEYFRYSLLIYVKLIFFKKSVSLVLTSTTEG